VRLLIMSVMSLSLSETVNNVSNESQS